MVRRLWRYLPLPIAALCYAYSAWKFLRPGWDDASPTFYEDAVISGLLAFGVLGIPGLFVLFFVRKIPVLSWAFLALVGAWTGIIALNSFATDGQNGCEGCSGAAVFGLLITWPAFLLVGFCGVLLLLERLLWKLEAWCKARKAGSISDCSIVR